VLQARNFGHFGKGPNRVLKGLNFAILFTAVSNLVKVFFTYKSYELEDGSCYFELPKYWSYLDEIMFGCIGMLTLLFLYTFYR
jgi:hypothetical protein